MNPGLPGPQTDLDVQRRMVRRAKAAGRRWILRGVLLAVIGVVGIVRGGTLMVTIGVVCGLLALLAVSLGRQTRLQAAEAERKIDLMARGGPPA